MAIAQEPNKWSMPLGANADANTIPDTAPESTGAASMNSVFPQITQVPLEAGGIAPTRADFNGLFKLLGDSIYYLQRGGIFSYADTVDYPAGAVVKYSNGIYIAIQANGPASTVAGPSNANYWRRLTTTVNNQYADANGNISITSVAHATSADSATNATNANHATSADSADSATNATHATSADSATNANHATSADSATNANHATSADSATNATNATHATSADSATNANHATSADSATNATNATNATIASNLVGHTFTSGDLINQIGGDINGGVVQKYGGGLMSDAPDSLKNSEITGVVFGDVGRKTVLITNYGGDEIYYRHIFAGGYLDGWRQIPSVDQGAGWVRFSNGVQICWGTGVTGPEGTGVYSYAKAFNAYPGVFLTVQASTSKTATNIYPTLAGGSVLTWDRDAVSSSEYYYMAIGTWK